MVAGLALVLAVIALMLAWSVLRGIWRSPQQVSLFFRHRRAMKGYLAISRGLIAIGAGNLKLARRSADDAARLSPGDPLALLLSAQSAQMAGDRAAAEHAFRAMSTREDTKVLGLRGLYVEAQRRDDAAAARRAAEAAAEAAPELAWAGQAVLDYRCGTADWSGALDALERMRPALDKADYRRKRAVLLTARAQALDDIDRDDARAAILEAVKLAPDLTPAAAMAGRRLAEAGEQRKARKILEAAWAANPHPDIAEAYADLRFGDSARDRLARMQKLAAMLPGQLEGALAVARAALDAREFAAARGGARALRFGADAPRRHADGGDRGGRARRRGPRARMDGARHARFRRSGLDGGRRGVGALAAGDAGRQARRLPVAPAAGRDRRQPASDRGGAAGGRESCASGAPAPQHAAAEAAAPARKPAKTAARIGDKSGKTTARRAGDPAGARARRSGPGSASRRRPGAGTDRAVARSLAAIHRAVPLIGPIACQACSAPISEARFQPA